MSTGGERRLLGAWGEEKAAAYLRRRGYRLLDANYHSRAEVGIGLDERLIQHLFFLIGHIRDQQREEYH